MFSSRGLGTRETRKKHRIKKTRLYFILHIKNVPKQGLGNKGNKEKT
jgi:hypothetical protein